MPKAANSGLGALRFAGFSAVAHEPDAIAHSVFMKRKNPNQMNSRNIRKQKMHKKRTARLAVSALLYQEN
jgi:hypothetical protein